MNDELITEAPVDAIDMYKSLSPQHRETDRHILDEFLERNIAVDSIRYAEIRDVRRGAVKSIDGAKYYFHQAPNVEMRVVVADTVEKSTEIDRILRTGRLGIDLKKASSRVTDEDEEKAVEGASASLPPASMKEDQAVAQANSQVTDVHPGATVSQTPQSDASSARWHGVQKSEADEVVDMLKSTTAHLRRAMPEPVYPLESLERSFMREILGKSLEQINAGARLTPAQRTQFSRWSAQRLRGTVSALDKLVRRGS